MSPRLSLSRLAPLSLLPWLAAAASAQVTIHVPADIATIKGAILAANSGDTILVAPGTYLEHDVSLMGKAVTLTSSGGAGVTTIHAQNLGRGLLFTSGEGPGTIVEGFRILAGNGPGGGGIFCASAPVIRDCIVEACSAISGFNGSGGGSGGGGYPGGGMFVSDGSPRVERCVFRGNHAGTGGSGGTGIAGQDGALFSPPTNGNPGGTGGPGGHGGGIYVSGGAPLFVGLQLTLNQAGTGGSGGRGGRGGNGIAFQDGANGGRGGNGGLGGFGGAVYVAGGTPRFVNCTIAANPRGLGGAAGAGGSGGTGGTGASNGSPGSSGSTGSTGAYAGIYGTASVLVQNSILWGNEFSPVGGGVSITASTVQFGYAGVGNISLDPQLLGLTMTTLLPSSPCIDAGNDLWVPAGTTTDIDGHPRFFDHPVVPSATPGSTVDMGCSEFVAPFVLPYGCVTPGGLSLMSGTPAPGATLAFAVDDTETRLGAQAALLVGTAPGGCTHVNGGVLLVDLAQPYAVLLGHGTGPQTIELAIPPDPGLIGTSLYVQGATIAPQGARPGLAPARDPLAWTLLDALQVVIGP